MSKAHLTPHAEGEHRAELLLTNEGDADSSVRLRLACRASSQPLRAKLHAPPSLDLGDCYAAVPRRARLTLRNISDEARCGGDVGRCGGDVGEMWGGVGRCGEIWGDVGRSRIHCRIRRCTSRSPPTHRRRWRSRTRPSLPPSLLLSPPIHSQVAFEDALLGASADAPPPYSAHDMEARGAA